MFYGAVSVSVSDTVLKFVQIVPIQVNIGQYKSMKVNIDQCRSILLTMRTLYQVGPRNGFLSGGHFPKDFVPSRS